MYTSLLILQFVQSVLILGLLVTDKTLPGPSVRLMIRFCESDVESLCLLQVVNRALLG